MSVKRLLVIRARLILHLAKLINSRESKAAHFGNTDEVKKQYQEEKCQWMKGTQHFKKLVGNKKSLSQATVKYKTCMLLHGANDERGF